MRKSFAVCLILCLVVAGYAGNRSIRFHSVEKLRTEYGVVPIVVDSDDFTVGNLVRLVSTLRRRHSEWKRITLVFFTSRQAAKDFNPSPVNDMPAAMIRAQKQAHALYWWDKAAKEEHLDMLPDGWRTPRHLATSINLPAAQEPRCTLELKRRCVLVLGQSDYPYEAVQGGVSGTVALGATIDYAGHVRDVHILEASIIPAEAQKL